MRGKPLHKIAKWRSNQDKIGQGKKTCTYRRMEVL